MKKLFYFRVAVHVISYGHTVAPPAPTPQVLGPPISPSSHGTAGNRQSRGLAACHRIQWHPRLSY